MSQPNAVDVTESPSPADRETLDRYEGTWLNHKTQFPTVSNKETHTGYIVEYTRWSLRGAMLMSQMVNMSTTVKSLWFLSPAGPGRFQFWFFDSQGYSDLWNFKWDEHASTMICGPNTEMPGVHAVSYHVFGADKSYYGLLMMTNDAGEKLGHLLGKKYMQPRILAEKMLEWWNEPQTPAVPLPSEVKKLDAFVGEWAAVVVQSPSISCPNGRTDTGRATAEWIVDGHFVLCSFHTEAYESKIVLGYDAEKSAYRCCSFPSIGQIEKLDGHLNGETNTFDWTYENTPPDISRMLTIHVISDDKIQVRLRDENEGGKLVRELRVELTRSQQPVVRPKAAVRPLAPLTDPKGRRLPTLDAF